MASSLSLRVCHKQNVSSGACCSKKICACSLRARKFSLQQTNYAATPKFFCGIASLGLWCTLVSLEESNHSVQSHDLLHDLCFFFHATRILSWLLALCMSAIGWLTSVVPFCAWKIDLSGTNSGYGWQRLGLMVYPQYSKGWCQSVTVLAQSHMPYSDHVHSAA